MFYTFPPLDVWTFALSDKLTYVHILAPVFCSKVPPSLAKVFPYRLEKVTGVNSRRLSDSSLLLREIGFRVLGVVALLFFPPFRSRQRDSGVSGENDVFSQGTRFFVDDSLRLCAANPKG